MSDGSPERYHEDPEARYLTYLYEVAEAYYQAELLRSRVVDPGDEDFS